MARAVRAAVQEALALLQQRARLELLDVLAQGERSVDVIDWIEKIPFSETRIYVWRVLENSVMYDLLHRPSSMPPVPNRLSTYLAKQRPE